MGNSIQDYLKKINSRLSSFDMASIAITAFFLLLLSVSLVWRSEATTGEVVYRTPRDDRQSEIPSSSPYGSKNGATYTYSWCQGGDRIKPENVVYFGSAEEAEQKGRRISKLCQK